MDGDCENGVVYLKASMLSFFQAGELYTDVIDCDASKAVMFSKALMIQDALRKAGKE